LDPNMKALGPVHGPISNCAQMDEFGLRLCWPNFSDLGPIFWHQEVATVDAMSSMRRIW
jgi:hypothetical protein